MKRFYYSLPLIFIFFISCKVSYLSKPFNENEVPVAPLYSSSHDWAVLPNKMPEQLKTFITTEATNLKADVFFVYPTLFIDKKNDAWNADTRDSIFNQKILDKSIHYQASAWVNAGRLFVPYYRQSHYRIYLEPYKKQATPSYEIAYSDIKKAFDYYLKNYNNGRPIIIASHSQGSILCKRLLKEFFDGTPLQKKLIAAYIPGTRVLKTDFTSLKPMLHPNDIGGYVAWNSYKKNKYPKRYNSWFQGGVTINPITWSSEQKSQKQQHQGMLYSNNKIYPKSIEVEVHDGLLWVSLPQVPKRFFMQFIYDYHFADINLFWKDIQLNAQLRVDTYFFNAN